MTYNNWGMFFIRDAIRQTLGMGGQELGPLQDGAETIPQLNGGETK